MSELEKTIVKYSKTAYFSSTLIELPQINFSGIFGSTVLQVIL